MSYYGSKTFQKKFSIHKKLVKIGESDRFANNKPYVAYNAADGNQIELPLHHSGVFVVTPVDSDIVYVRLTGVNPNAASSFSNLELINVVDSYNLAVGKAAVVLEGAIECDGTIHDSDINLSLIEGESEKALTGTGKVLVLNYTY